MLFLLYYRYIRGCVYYFSDCGWQLGVHQRSPLLHHRLAHPKQDRHGLNTDSGSVPAYNCNQWSSNVSTRRPSDLISTTTGGSSRTAAKDSSKLNNRTHTRYTNEIKVIKKLNTKTALSHYGDSWSICMWTRINIPPLQEGATLITDAVQSAFQFGKEFHSAFTREDPSHIPSLSPRTSSTMTPTHVEVPEVDKLCIFLLSNTTHK